MGALASCFHVPDVQDNPASNNSISPYSCLCPKCFFQRFKNKLQHRNIFRLGQTRGVSSPNQQLSCSNSGLVSNNSSYARVQGNVTARERREEDSDHARVKVELRQDDAGVNKKPITQVVSKEENSEPASTFPSPDDEDVCPTCLEDYSEENPKIIAKCCHHYHLSCIYEWMERSENCPMCGKLMLFDE